MLESMSEAPAEFDRLYRTFDAWNAADVGGEFDAAVSIALDQVVKAMRDRDYAFGPSAAATVAHLFAIEPVLRARRMIGWDTALRLSKTRTLAACLIGAAQRDEAYAMLADQAGWVKEVLATFRFGSIADYDAAGMLVLSATVSYLLAFRYLKPEACHIADNGIPEDFDKTFRRIFGDETLQASVKDFIAARPQHA